MKRFMKFVSTVLVLGAVAVASNNAGGNPEVSVKKNDLATVNGHCDPIERALGACRSSQDLTKEN